MNLNRPATQEPQQVNGRSYRWPRQPVVVICYDGCDPAYIDAGREAGVIPVTDRMTREGFATTCLAAMPTFTNPNNMSIVTGVAPAQHGVSGNFYLDQETGREVMVTDGASLRAPTVLAAFAAAGAKVATVTAKDKLRKGLGQGLAGISFSAEAVERCTEAEHGIDDVVGLVGRPAPKPRPYAASHRYAVGRWRIYGPRLQLAAAWCRSRQSRR